MIKKNSTHGVSNCVLAGPGRGIRAGAFSRAAFREGSYRVCASAGCCGRMEERRNLSSHSRILYKCKVGNSFVEHLFLFAVSTCLASSGLATSPGKALRATRYASAVSPLHGPGRVIMFVRKANTEILPRRELEGHPIHPITHTHPHTLTRTLMRTLTPTLRKSSAISTEVQTLSIR